MIVDNHIYVIDRRNNFFKLQQGEFVAPERLEAIYLNECDLIEQLFICANSTYTYICAVAKLSPEKLNTKISGNLESVKKAMENNEEIIEDEKISNTILAQFREIANNNSLRSFEVPKFIICTTKEFTVENGLMTATKKKARRNLTNYFSAKISEVSEIYDNKNSRTKDDIFKILFNIKGGDESEESKQIPAGLGGMTLSEFGIDSLSYSRFYKTIKEHFGVEISIEKFYTIKTLEDLLSFIHGKDRVNLVKTQTQKKNQIEWEKEAKLSEFLKGQQKYMELRSLRKVENKKISILLTGVTGFLGKFLLHNLIEYYSNLELKVYCFMRFSNKNKKEAKKHLKNQLKAAFLWEKEKYKNKVEVVIGDLSKSSLGLDLAELSFLLDEIDEVYHCAAWVNSLLDYSTLKPSNVTATENLLEFSIIKNIKTFHFISTSGIFDKLNMASNGEAESSRIQPTSDHLFKLSGYSQSKWVAERLVSNTALQLGVPVTIHRPGLVSSHSISFVFLPPLLPFPFLMFFFCITKGLLKST